MKAEKALAMKVKIVDEVLRGPKHKVPERTAIFDPKTEELITDENIIRNTKYSPPKLSMSSPLPMAPQNLGSGSCDNCPCSISFPTPLPG